MIKIEQELITPEIAAKYLKGNSQNRRLREKLISNYANQMKKGLWKFGTMEMIKISQNGVVLDGQHRLHAVIQSGVSVWFHIAKNMADDVFDVIDTGSPRHAVDAFTVAGIKNENYIPPIIAFYNVLKDGYSNRGLNRNQKMSNSELLDTYYENREKWQKIARMADRKYRDFSKIIPRSKIGGYYAYFSDISEKKAELFINQLCTGMNIENDSIALLRNKMINDKMSQVKMTEKLKMALVIKAWNHFMTGRKVKNLLFNQEKEDFPAAVGLISLS